MVTHPLSNTLPIDAMKSVETLLTNGSGWYFSQRLLNTSPRRWIDPYSSHLQALCTLRLDPRSVGASERALCGIGAPNMTRDRDGLRCSVHFLWRSGSIGLRDSLAGGNLLLLHGSSMASHCRQLGRPQNRRVRRITWRRPSGACEPLAAVACHALMRSSSHGYFGSKRDLFGARTFGPTPHAALACRRPGVPWAGVRSF